MCRGLIGGVMARFVISRRSARSNHFKESAGSIKTTCLRDHVRLSGVASISRPVFLRHGLTATGRRQIKVIVFSFVCKGR